MAAEGGDNDGRLQANSLVPHFGLRRAVECLEDWRPRMPKLSGDHADCPLPVSIGEDTNRR